jgi:hypothetical protein
VFVKIEHREQVWTMFRVKKMSRYNIGTINRLYHSHLYLQAVKLKLATPLSRLQVVLCARPLKAPYLVNSFFGR